MPVNPDDLLVFKLRETKKKQAKDAKQEAQKKAAAPKEQAQPQVQAAQKAPQVTGRVEQKNIQTATAAAPAEKPQAANVAAEAATAKQLSDIYAAYFAMQPGEEERKSYEEAEQTLLEGMEQREEAVETNKPQRGKTFTKNEKESIEAAKGLMCVNHPWRPAYAICDYCHRPFCYADLVEYNNRFYCLEDIDKVSGGARNVVQGMSHAARLSGLLFLANAAFLGYFILPQARFLFYYIAKIGFSSFLDTITYGYAISLMNFLFVVLGAISGFLLLLGVRKSMALGGGVGAIVLVGISYEYLNSTATYLLVTSILSFAMLGALAYGRISSKVAEEEEDMNTEVMWPRVETF